MVVSVKEGKRVFSIAFEKESILEELKEARGGWEEDVFVPYGQMPGEGHPMTQEEYTAAYDDMIAYVQNITEDDLRKIIADWTRKKNGSFNRRLMTPLFDCNATEYICEWHNTWIYQRLKVTASSDFSLEVTLYQMVDTPA